MKIFISTIIISSLLYSQGEVTIDTLLTNQEKILINQQMILSEVVYIDPLLNIEFNPAYFLMSSASNEGFILSGSFSLFSISEKAEIAFPIYFTKGEDDLKIFHIDSHYRYFTDKELSIIGAGPADSNAIIDMELLKIGKMF